VTSQQKWADSAKIRCVSKNLLSQQKCLMMTQQKMPRKQNFAVSAKMSWSAKYAVSAKSCCVSKNHHKVRPKLWLYKCPQAFISLHQTKSFTIITSHTLWRFPWRISVTLLGWRFPWRSAGAAFREGFTWRSIDHVFLHGCVPSAAAPSASRRRLTERSDEWVWNPNLNP